ncbi:MAG: copper homeostasis protein CutC [Bacteroidota bacterium]|nr:copper homeostasis protein CutC [Bacteroidota bacterium]
MKKPITIEVCANSVESALAAQNGGAARVELCSNLLEGGTTPSYATIETARKMLSIKINVLIRPRGGDFLYNDLEFSIMKRDIEICKSLNVDGIVIGMLNDDGSVDKSRMPELINLARPLSVTFHRAFDMCRDPFDSLQCLIDLGIDRLLTSGQQNSVLLGAKLIAGLVKFSAGRLAIMPGAGINSSNILEIIKATGADEFHLSGKKTCLSKMKYQNTSLNMGNTTGVSEFSTELTDSNEIQKIVAIVNHLMHGS